MNDSFADNQSGAEELALKILECLKQHLDINTIVAALESTSIYSIHIASNLSSCEELMLLLSQTMSEPERLEISNPNLGAEASFLL